jgi:hypothetical protein
MVFPIIEDSQLELNVCKTCPYATKIIAIPLRISKYMFLDLLLVTCMFNGISSINFIAHFSYVAFFLTEYDNHSEV